MDADLHGAVDASTLSVPAPCPPFDGGLSELSRASLAGDIDDVRRILTSASPNDRLDACHPTPLMEALAPFIAEPNASAKVERLRAERKQRIANMLLDAGANVRLSDQYGMTALHFAVHAYFAEESTSQLVRRILSAGADVNARTGHGVTPLLMAVDRRRAKLVRILLEAGADAALADASGDTPKSVASRLGDAELLRLLGERMDAGGGGR